MTQGFVRSSGGTDPTKIPLTEKAAALGVATLDAGTKIPIAQIPNEALERYFEVANQVLRYALTYPANVQNGDIVKQLDTGVTYVVIDQTQLGVAAGWTILGSGVDNFSYERVITGNTVTIPVNQQMVVTEAVVVETGGTLNIDGTLAIIA